MFSARLAPALALIPLIAGCAAAGEFPSLQPRPVEQLSMEEPVREAAVVPADSALVGRARALLTEAQRGDQAFEVAYGRALPAVRAAGRSGSDSWINAQQAISRVEAARADTSTALANLDQLVGERDDVATNADDEAEIRAMLVEVSRIADDQQRRTTALRSQVGGP